MNRKQYLEILEEQELHPSQINCDKGSVVIYDNKDMSADRLHLRKVTDRGDYCWCFTPQ
ncbi:MAG: hypothetical protein ABIA21_01945 [Candidatus Aenigmatarchaeota archaeon]